MTTLPQTVRIWIWILSAMLLLGASACASDTPEVPETDTPGVSETTSDTILETESETESISTTETETETEAETETESEVENQTESTTSEESETASETAIETMTETVTATETETVTETETETVTETQAETETETETVSAGYRPAEEVKVVSFNLDANEATIAERAPRLLSLIRSFEPDSIGVQEARGSWVRQLNTELMRKGYTRVGVDAGGNPNASGGYFATYIFFRTDKYDLLDSGTFWMSKTPDVPSIYDSTVDCNRTCTWALLENKETGFRYVHMNTHLDWMNMEVNRIQVAMIREQIERFEAMGYPVFATGDYNCDEGTASYHEMLKSDRIADSKHVADKTMNLGTYPSYGQYDVTVTKPIDYVFVTKNAMTVHEYKVIDEKPDGKYVSDHNGLFVHATVNALPITEESRLLPQWAQDAITVTPAGVASVDVTIAQAMDAVGNMASKYRLELIGTNTKTVMVSSGVLTPEPPNPLIYTLGGLTHGQSYTLRVTPISILGDEGACAEVPFTFVSPVPPAEPESMSAADIFDLSVQDNKPVDISPNAMPITVLGSPSIDGQSHLFHRNGNYKVPNFKQHYAKLQNGFTVEVSMTTGEDVTTYSNPVANFHAGGFGIGIDSARISFGVHVGGKYIYLYTPIEKNTTYHIVGSYDPDSGEMRLYVNGALQEQTKVSGSMGLPTEVGAQYLCIGADSDATGAGEYPMEGTLHSLRIYDRTANDGNVLWLWNQVYP